MMENKANMSEPHLIDGPLDEADIIRLLGGERVDWDPRLPGFGLRRRATGGCSWTILTRVDGKVTRMTLGTADRVSKAAAKMPQ